MKWQTVCLRVIQTLLILASLWPGMKVSAAAKVWHGILVWSVHTIQILIASDKKLACLQVCHPIVASFTVYSHLCSALPSPILLTAVSSASHQLYCHSPGTLQGFLSNLCLYDKAILRCPDDLIFAACRTLQLKPQLAPHHLSC